LKHAKTHPLVAGVPPQSRAHAKVPAHPLSALQAASSAQHLAYRHRSQAADPYVPGNVQARFGPGVLVGAERPSPSLQATALSATASWAVRASTVIDNDRPLRCTYTRAHPDSEREESQAGSDREEHTPRLHRARSGSSCRRRRSGCSTHCPSAGWAGGSVRCTDPWRNGEAVQQPGSEHG
jgi:hypothetical protein